MNKVPSRAQSIQTTAQTFGAYLAGMIMPNIGAFIAWGLITALFIPNGWLPDARIALIVEPMIKILLPVLVGYTGGRLVHGQRGAVVGSVATLGIVIGAGTPMFLGAMVVGPFAALLLKYFDKGIGSRVAPGFRMLVDNFSSGIIGGLVAIGGMLGMGPVVEVLTRWLGSGVSVLIELGLLPLVSVIIEPAKVLFLNNAVNHGVLGPLGVSDAETNGKAIQFLLETNPGPGLGILLACALFGRPDLQSTAPGAAVIHFLGGIHEIYFPYVLATPRLILAAIMGGASGVFLFAWTGVGLTATPSPGSIIAIMAVTHLGVLAGVVVSAVVAFFVSAILLKLQRHDETREDFIASNETGWTRN
jgi:PTS system mannitol-specific IIC component